MFLLIISYYTCVTNVYTYVTNVEVKSDQCLLIVEWRNRGRKHIVWGVAHREETGEGEQTNKRQQILSVSNTVSESVPSDYLCISISKKVQLGKNNFNSITVSDDYDSWYNSAIEHLWNKCVLFKFRHSFDFIHLTMYSTVLSRTLLLKKLTLRSFAWEFVSAVVRLISIL